MYCTNCGFKNEDDAKFCSGCGRPLEQKAPDIPQAPYIPYTQPPVKKKKSALVIVLPVILVLVAAIAAIYFLFWPKPNLKLGRTVEAGTVTAAATGSILTLDDPSIGIEGVEITVPENAYPNDIDFTVKTTPINSHKFGKEFEPVSPLITIDNGGVFAQKPLAVTVPIDILENEFAMGFYYDRDTGAIEAIPFEELTTDSITLVTSHFSEFFIAKTTKYALDQGGPITTGFEPGIDDWQFVNYGSAISPGGHCAGQSLTMLWYYAEKHIKAGESELYGRFDNNGSDKTTEFWQDDSHAYRFASVVQSDINWTSPEYQRYLALSAKSEENTYYAFAFAMKMTGSPQFMGIYSLDNNGNRTGGHAIVAYKIENDIIHVADPNYPGQTDRGIQYSINGLEPYSSGANAFDIHSNGTILYEEIIFVGTSALVDFNTIDTYYDGVTDGSIGDDRFPTIDLYYLSDYGDGQTNVVYTQAPDVLPNYSDATMPQEYKGTIMIAVTTGYTDVQYTVYDGTTPLLGPGYPDEDGIFLFTYTLEDGVNDIGVLAEIPDGQRSHFADFKRLLVSTGDIQATDAPTPTPITSTSSSSAAPSGNIAGRFNFVSRSDGQVLVNYHYIQINSDGTYMEEYQPKGDTYIGGTAGTWKLASSGGQNILSLYDPNGTLMEEYTVSGDFKIIQRDYDDGSGNIIRFIFSK